MSFSENILFHLKSIQESERCNLFEAVVSYCEAHEIDIEELIESLDASAIEQIKAAAIEGNHVRRKIAKRTETLF